MDEFRVVKIIAVPDYSTRSTNNKLIPGHAHATLWEAGTNIPALEGPDGSDHCCTFKLDYLNMISLELSGSWTGISTTDEYTIEGLLNNKVLLESTFKSPHLARFDTPYLDLKTAPSFLCRYAGDWKWRIRRNKEDRWEESPDITRLELNFVFSGPPAGPLIAPTPDVRSRPDFNHEYPVDLFRLFIPKFDVPVPPTNTRQQWYFKRTMETIWKLGLGTNPYLNAPRPFQYEAISGGSSYIDTHIGGQFQLRRFVAGMFSTLNCYDLAALSQLAVCIIRDDSGDSGVEMYDSKYILCGDYGFIPDGTLFGWPQFPTCNSPFFCRGRLPHYPADDTNRQKFDRHAWVEVTSSSGTRTVLDATHCLLIPTPPEPASGTDDRMTYIGKYTDPTRGPYQRIYTENPGSSLQQIGVCGVGTVPFLGPSPVVEPHVEAAKPAPVNNAPCNDATILNVIKSVLPLAALDASDWQVGSRGCQALTAYKGIPDSSDRLFVELNNSETLHDALRQYQKYRDMLRDLTDPDAGLPPDGVGDLALRLPFHFLWRRNNMFIRVFANAPSTGQSQDIDIPDLILRASKAIDSYLSAHAVDPGREARPSPVLKYPEHRNIVVEGMQMVEVPLNNVEDISDICIAEIGDHTVVKQASIGATEDGRKGVIRLSTLDPGETDVAICVAHHLNLSTSTLKVSIKVVESAD